MYTKSTLFAWYLAIPLVVAQLKICWSADGSPTGAYPCDPVASVGVSLPL